MTIPHQYEPPTISSRDASYASWVCFFAWTFATFDFVAFGYLLPKLAADLNWSSAEATAINTAVLIGTAVVAMASGPIVDIIGRRKGMMLAIAGAAACSALTAVAGWVALVSALAGIVLMVVFRALGGFSLAQQAINATYLSELYAIVYTTPDKIQKRGLYYSLVQSGWPVGALIASLIIYVLFPIGGWSLVFLFALIPGVILFLAATRIKESPQFVARKKIEGFMAAGDTEHASAIARATGMSIGEHHSSLISVFRGESLRSMLFICPAFFLSWFGVLAFSILGTLILTEETGKGLEFNSAITILILSNISGFIGYLFHGWLGDRIGRRNTIALGWVAAFCVFGAMLLFIPKGWYWTTLAFYSAGLFFLPGTFAAVLFFVGESFPVHTRATGSALINGSGQIGSIIASFCITIAISKGMSWSNAAFYFGCIPVLLAAFLIMGARNVDPKIARAD